VNGGHILLAGLLVLAIAEIVYTQGCLLKVRGQLSVVKKERDVALSRIGIKPNVVPIFPGAVPLTCESCGNEDATFVVCTDCMMVMPAPSAENYRGEAHDLAMQNHPAGKKR
jgi:hypothetical protein